MSNFNKRLLTSVCLIAGCLIVFLLRIYVGQFGIFIFDAFILLAAGIATWEVCNARKLNERGANAAVAIVVYGLIYFFYIINDVFLNQPLLWWVQLIVSLVIIGIFVLFIGLSNMLDKNMAKNCRLKKTNLNREAWLGAWDLVQLFIYPGFFFACAILLNHLTSDRLGELGLLLVVFISALTDTCAYLVGMILGKNTAKMSPDLSPKKTWVGFIGSLFGGMLGALIVLLIVSNTAVIKEHLLATFDDATVVQLCFIVIGLVGAIITSIGDLTASLIKRKCGIKDYGNILPGHGGVMDRVDGIIFNVAFILLIMEII